MSMDIEVEALRRVSIFQDVELAKLRLLAFISKRMRFQPGEHVCTQGETGDSAFVIMNGQADVVVRTTQGERVVASLGESDIVGEIAVLCDVPRTATVTATSDLTVLAVSKENFLKLVREFPEMGLGIMRVLAHRLEKTTRDLAELRTSLPEG